MVFGLSVFFSWLVWLDGESPLVTEPERVLLGKSVNLTLYVYVDLVG